MFVERSYSVEMNIEMKICHAIIVLFMLGTLNTSSSQTNNYSIPFHNPQTCEPEDGYFKYFSSTRLVCVPCAQDAVFQKLSPDGMSCICQDGCRLTSISGGNIQCSLCPTDMVPSFSGWECVKCDSTCSSCLLGTRDILQERTRSGSFMPIGASSLTRQCVPCAQSTKPDELGQECLPCPEVFAVTQSDTCECPIERQARGHCIQTLPVVSADEDDEDELSHVHFEGPEFVSLLLKQYASDASNLCQDNWSSACQQLANLCTLVLGDGKYTSPSVCSIYLEILKTTAKNSASNQSVPWIVYSINEIDKKELFSADDIPTVYYIDTDPKEKNSANHLNFIVSMYHVNGTFLGFKSVKDGLLQLCTGSPDYLDAAFDFGVHFQHECLMETRRLFHSDRYETIIYELWLKNENDGGHTLHSIPIQIKGNASLSGAWSYVRRFFLVDSVSGIRENGSKAIRVATEFIIIVELQSGKDGRIFRPYVEITYSAVNFTAAEENLSLKVKFELRYTMDNKMQRLIFLAVIAVLSIPAVIYAGKQMNVWRKRSNKHIVDCAALVKFVVFCATFVGNLFFCAVFGASVWWCLLYKHQGIVVLATPNPLGPYFFMAMVAVFAVKLLDIIHIVVEISTCDIFFIDWEDPHFMVPPGRRGCDGDACSSSWIITTSIWRTYFVVRKWTSLMTGRRLRPTFRIATTILLLEFVVGNGGFTEDPWWKPVRTSPLLHPEYKAAPFNYMLRCAWIISIYVIMACFQQVYIFIYERHIFSHIMNFIDLCSVANVSTILFTKQLFGYYIHGRSIHDQSDVDLRSWHLNFLAEQMNLRCRRGLLPSNDDQTFIIFVPRKLRAVYDRIMLPLSHFQGQVGDLATHLSEMYREQGKPFLMPQIERQIVAYSLMNRTLRAFIKHEFHDMDYMIINMSKKEQLFGYDKEEPGVYGFFYIDQKHSFELVTLYGNEMTLIIFEVLLMCVVDNFFVDFITDGTIVYFVVVVLLQTICRAFGRVNIAKKSLLDKRLLL